ncbi:Gfo/Idh/MocA family oxidoreductase [Tessaracoccus rhinocerotis]|uniref:Gfo/Idh/MocA family oxidoreductase n=1 Tax=Tessaracoccus rhinocerotis TaxID=1689449 RepID=A0A553JZG0_9ACTN|nr:Gfo/Idh/MocA family oxidoreductase [Tessaracoccus rhinocerotis]TRY17834.1 Gfo/Idh/MocA family oxidoreductase [Tessaracoccus rhinocerotis]
MDTIRWGFVGAGGIADVMASDFGFVPNAELAAIASRDLGRAEEFAAKHGIERAYGSYADLLDDETIDVVYLANTHPHHHDVALAAIERGKALLVEKSFTATLAGTEEVVAAARAKGVFCMEAMWTRFLPAVAAAREVVAWGRIGDVLGVQGDLSAYRAYDPSHRLFDPATGGGAMLDLGVYVVSFAQSFLGAGRAVNCVGRFAPNGVDMAAAINIEHEGGGLASLACGFDGHGPGRMVVHGTKGWIEVEPRFHHPTTLSVHRTGVLPRVIEANMTGRGYCHEITEVTDRVLAGDTESPVMPLSDTIEVMRILEECLRQLGIEQSEARVAI